MHKTCIAVIKLYTQHENLPCCWFSRFKHYTDNDEMYVSEIF